MHKHIQIYSDNICLFSCSHLQVRYQVAGLEEPLLYYNLLHFSETIMTFHKSLRISFNPWPAFTRTLQNSLRSGLHGDSTVLGLQGWLQPACNKVSIQLSCLLLRIRTYQEIHLEFHHCKEKQGIAVLFLTYSSVICILHILKTWRARRTLQV